MLRARSHTDAESIVERSADRSSFLALVAVALSAMGSMALFEALRDSLAFRLTPWQSNVATVALSTLVATGCAYVVRHGIAQNERAVEVERSLLRRVTDGIPYRLFVKDLEGRYLLANRQFAEFKGMGSDANLVGKVAYEFMSQELATVIEAEDLELKTGLSSMIEREQSTTDEAGHVNWHVTIKVPLRGKGGAIVAIAGLQRDITRKKRDERALREQETRLLAAQQIGHLGSFEVELIEGMDPELCPMRCSDELLRIAGFDVRDAASARVRPNIFRLADREDWELTKAAIADAIRERKPYSLDFWMICPDGTRKALQGAGDVIRDPYTGKNLKLQGMIHDITERKRAEEQFAEANTNLAQRLEELQRRSNEMHLLSEMGGWLQSCNSIDEAFAAIGKSVAPLFPGWGGALFAIGASRNIVEVVAEWGSPILGQRVFEPEECWALRRIRIHRFNATESSIHCGHVDASLVGESLCVPLMAHGETFGILHLQPQSESAEQMVLSTPRSPADQKLAAVLAEQIGLALGNLKLRETLRNQSVRDPLTGLYNRRYMEESLEREISRANRDRGSIAILMVDLDHFKRFNDTFGHQAGDAALRSLGDFLKKNTRGQDIVCRYGGEEFALVFSGATLEGAVERAEALRVGVKRMEVQYMGQLLGTITVSMGIALFPEHGSNVAEVLRGADQALYSAKREGRDQICVWAAQARV